MFGLVSVRFWPGFYTRANAESYKDLGDDNRGVQEGQYFTVLTGSIFYGIDEILLTFNILKVENKKLNCRTGFRMAVLVLGFASGQYSNP